MLCLMLEMQIFLCVRLDDLIAVFASFPSSWSAEFKYSRLDVESILVLRQQAQRNLVLDNNDLS